MQTPFANPHPVRLIRPFYLAGEHGGLHRYLDPDFVNGFHHAAERGALAASVVAPGAGGPPLLPLPLHRNFHVFCCEVVCDRPGAPALDPKRIESAGFVIRRVSGVGGGDGEAWMVEDGTAIGWQPVVPGGRDPDLARRLAPLAGVRGIAPPTLIAGQAGELTHPLHPLLVRDGDGRSRSLLYGYVPLGGSYYRRGPVATPAEQAAFAEQAEATLPWPFGYRGLDRVSAKRWPRAQRYPLVSAGVPEWAFFELLQVLVGRYHVGDPAVADNLGLLALAERLTLSPGLTLAGYLRTGAARGGDNPLVAWLARNDTRRAQAGARPEALPRIGPPGTLDVTLDIDGADAQEWRAALGQRLLAGVAELANEIPLPRFSQEADDLYQVVPFVRVRDDCGCVHLQWGEAQACSQRFRVASPFDPRASRPSLVQMPSLADLRRGMARGASMLTPPDTFAMLNALRLGKGAGPDAVPDEPPAGGGALQWICSFSLPVITLVAMILLMIMVSVLNLLFFWLPWVRICLPFPKLGKKGGPSG